MIHFMNRNSPVPLWAVLSVGVALLGGGYLAAQTVITPHFGTRTLEPTLSSRRNASGSATAAAPSVTPSIPSPSVAASTVADSANEPTSSTLISGDGTASSEPCSGNWNLETGRGQWNWKFSTDLAQWPTYTDAEDFFSIKYPDLGGCRYSGDSELRLPGLPGADAKPHSGHWPTRPQETSKPRADPVCCLQPRRQLP